MWPAADLVKGGQAGLDGARGSWFVRFREMGPPEGEAHAKEGAEASKGGEWEKLGCAPL